MNLRSILCDNIASCPEFKPEKTKSLREHYFTSTALQAINGLGPLLEAHHFGEDIDFNKINEEKEQKFHGTIGFIKSLLLVI